jgi:hypothetical protein
MLAASLVSVLFAVMVIWLRVNQVIAGLALVFFCQGLTALVGSLAGLDQPAATEGIGAMALWPLSLLPGVGRLFEQNAMVWLTLPIFGAVAWFFARTTTGLRLRAVGENPQAADAAGIRVTAWRFARGARGLGARGPGGRLHLGGEHQAVDRGHDRRARLDRGGPGDLRALVAVEGARGRAAVRLHRGADPATGRGRRATAAVLRDDDAVRGHAGRDGLGRAGQAHGDDEPGALGQPYVREERR